MIRKAYVGLLVFFKKYHIVLTVNIGFWLANATQPPPPPPTHTIFLPIQTNLFLSFQTRKNKKKHYKKKKE
jgi:hypothetical protein